MKDDGVSRVALLFVLLFIFFNAPLGRDYYRVGYTIEDLLTRYS